MERSDERVSLVGYDVSPQQTALLMRLTGFERARIGRSWYRVVDLSHGQEVNEINYFGRYSIRPGDTLGLYGADSVEVIDIRFVECDQLSAEEIAALEQAELPERGLYIGIAPVDPQRRVAPPEVSTLNEVMTAQEVAVAFDLSESTVRVNIHRGNLPARKSGGTWLVRRVDAEQRWGAK